MSTINLHVNQKQQKWLIYGHRGWIGQQFYKIIQSTMQNIAVICGQARCDDLADVRTEIATVQPDRVILFIGRTHGITEDGKQWSTIDYLEQPGKLHENVRDNMFSPLAIALICHDAGVHLTYLGTGCIFQFDDANDRPFGQEKNGFTESDDPNFFGSSYSIVKGFTDRTMRLLDDLGYKILNLRIRMPITGQDNPRNFITKITNYARICSVPNSMSVLDELLPAAAQLVAKSITGTLNLTNPGLISHNEMLEMYREIVDPEFKWVNMTVVEQNKVLASGRSNNYLDTTRLERLISDGTITTPIHPVKEAVRLAMYRYKEGFIPAIRILVTGGCGFIGSNFINYIMAKHENIVITNMDALYYCAKEENVCENIRQDNKRYHFIQGNLKDVDVVRRVVDECRPQYVVHFAAQSHVDNSFANSVQFTMDNVLGTHNLLECVRTSPYRDQLRKFVHVSTDEVYGESMIALDEKHKTEHSVLCPTNPYAATKAGAELIASSYRHSFGLPVIVTRGNNVYGPNQYPEKLIPRFIDLLKSGERLTIAGKGEQMRSFLHVYDTSSAFECIIFKGVVGEIYNIGTHDELSVMEVARRCIALWYDISLDTLEDKARLEPYITFIPDRPYNDMRYFISNDKLRELGWNIKYTFMEGLRELIRDAKLQVP